MSNVRPQPEETIMLVGFALNILRSCNQHRLFEAHSGVNLLGLPFLQLTNQPSSQPTLKTKGSSHFQPPPEGAFFNLRPLRLRSETTSQERSSPAHAKNKKSVLRCLAFRASWWHCSSSSTRVHTRFFHAHSTSAPNPAVNTDAARPGR